MIGISGFKVEGIIHQSLHTIVYCGYREQDKVPVVIKALKTEYPTHKEIARLRHEYDIVKHLDIPGVRRAYALLDCSNGIALVSEDFGATPLSEFLADQPLAIPQFLRVAIALTETLGLLHQNNIIHKDIKPQNIILNPTTGEIQIIDFGISTRLPRENQSSGSPRVLEGTLAYISPEQTGRMNRLIDYRTDFYSLGITFYEMLTGRTPFISNDPLELVHCHIARVPPPPTQFNPKIPTVLSAIVLKLMAKTAEERYQSAQGLKADLEECLRQWEIQGTITNFPLAQFDIADRLEIAQKLYGRDAEATLLMNAFERITQGQSELMLVYGYSGVGKSSLIHEIHKPLVQTRGYFISGKFDQLQRSIPYGSVIQAFQDLVQQLLTENEAQMQGWKTKLLNALGSNGQVVVDVIPAIELIIGKQPPMPELPLAEAQNRFNSVIQKFVRVFAQAEHPLVWFLDDLQWADSATLKLIQVLTTDLTSQHLLLIGAYRDNEVSSSHPLMLMLDQIEKNKGIVNRLCLQPLVQADLNQLTADTLKCDIVSSEPLAELIFNKTQGNPFFAAEFLKYIYQENFLCYDYAQCSWQWQLDQIRELDATDNVIDLMTRKVQRLQTQTQQILKLAACIGNQFDLRTLAIVNQQSPTKTADGLWEAVVAGLVLPIGESYKWIDNIEHSEDINVRYKFLHDRVQQAIYALIPENEKKKTHLSIGRLMLKDTQEELLEKQLFNIVNQLNIGLNLIDDLQDRIHLAQLNLKAGQKAKLSAAYDAAIAYLQTGFKLLPNNCWDTCYSLAFSLHLGLSECACVAGQLALSEQLVDIALSHAKTKLEQAKVYSVKMLVHTDANRISDVLETGRSALNLFGCDFPLDPEPLQATVQQELAQIQLNLAGLQISELIDLPEISDPEVLAVLIVLRDMTVATYRMSPTMLALVAVRTVDLVLQFGIASVAALGISAYAVISCAALGDIQTGYEFGRLAMAIADKYNDAQMKCKSCFPFGAMINHWKQPMQTSSPYLIKSYQNGLEVGDFGFASFAVLHIIWRLLETGVFLDNVYDEVQKYKDFLKRHKDPTTNYLYTGQCQAILSLKGEEQSQFNLELTDEPCDQTRLLEYCRAQEEASNLQFYYVERLRVLYFLERYHEARELGEATAETILNLLPGQVVVTEHCFYYTLVLTALYADLPQEEQQPTQQILLRNQERMKRWSDDCPHNFLYKYYLMSAEVARLEEKDHLAWDLYDQAIQAAYDCQFAHHEALGNELAGKFYLSKGKNKIAKAYLQDARLGYLKWGATAKVKLLDEHYGSLLAISLDSQYFTEPNDTLAVVSTSSTDAEKLDLMTVIKASQALSGEIVLNNLLDKLLRIVTENAGAQRGAFVLNKDDKWVIEAEATLAEQASIQSVPLEESQSLPISVINYVRHTKQPLVLHNAHSEKKFKTDPYVVQHQPKSVLCLPVIHQGKLTGILYLENNLSSGVFTRDRIELLNLLTTQVSISIDNAQLYETAQLDRAASEAARREAESANRLKDEFLAVLSHELRTPLNPILGWTRMLRSQQLDATKTNQALETIERNAKLQARLIEDLLDVSSILQGKMALNIAPVNLTTIIEAALETVRLAAEEKQLDIQTRLSFISGSILGDANRLQQIVWNLLSNAVKFTPSGGQIEVRLEQFGNQEWAMRNREMLYQSPTLKFQSPTYAQITITDTGRGISPDFLPHIFDYFRQEDSTTTRRFGGLGLGLAIVRQLVELHEGTIQAESQGEGQGATFIVRLPLVSNTPLLNQGGCSK
ncbi:ATP-binding sensor histidine kinase [Leptolyngbya sp. FACHB-16]|uniref:ATP-binding sensor histidine kinase n=1 Tax=unclassified Leptolyngbya TaxID=2650499 RepID=UPI001688B6D9|nr:ATP-binding sensor histidine kinase [Leptolyngbya sp. FACHB-16]MBD2152968.1 AAA family ATPase [Leptolyngbya sp. FACHB-16]